MGGSIVFLQLVFARAVDTHLHFLASVQQAMRLCRDSCCASMTDDEHMMLHRGNYCTSPARHVRCEQQGACPYRPAPVRQERAYMHGERTASGQSCESRHAFPMRNKHARHVLLYYYGQSSPAPLRLRRVRRSKANSPMDVIL